MNASAGSLSTNSIKHSPCFTSRQMKEAPLEVALRDSMESLLRPCKNVEEVQGLEWKGLGQ